MRTSKMNRYFFKIDINVQAKTEEEARILIMDRYHIAYSRLIIDKIEVGC